MGKWVNQLTAEQAAACTRLGVDWDARAEEHLKNIVQEDVRVRLHESTAKMAALPIEKQAVLIANLKTATDIEVGKLPPPPGGGGK